MKRLADIEARRRSQDESEAPSLDALLLHNVCREPHSSKTTARTSSKDTARTSARSSTQSSLSKLGRSPRAKTSGDPLVDKVMRSHLHERAAAGADLPAGMTRLCDDRPSFDPRFETHVQRQLLASRRPESSKPRRTSYLIKSTPTEPVKKDEPYSLRRMSAAAYGKAAILVSRMKKHTVDFRFSAVTVLFGAKLRCKVARRREAEARRRHVAISIALVRMTQQATQQASAPQSPGRRGRRGAVDLIKYSSGRQKVNQLASAGRLMQGGVAFATRARRSADAPSVTEHRLTDLERNLQKEWDAPGDGGLVPKW